MQVPEMCVCVCVNIIHTIKCIQVPEMCVCVCKYSHYKMCASAWNMCVWVGGSTYIEKTLDRKWDQFTFDTGMMPAFK